MIARGSRRTADVNMITSKEEKSGWGPGVMIVVVSFHDQKLMF